MIILSGHLLAETKARMTNLSCIIDIHQVLITGLDTSLFKDSTAIVKLLVQVFPLHRLVRFDFIIGATHVFFALFVLQRQLFLASQLFLWLLLYGHVLVSYLLIFLLLM